MKRDEAKEVAKDMAKDWPYAVYPADEADAEIVRLKAEVASAVFRERAEIVAEMQAAHYGVASYNDLIRRIRSRGAPAPASRDEGKPGKIELLVRGVSGTDDRLADKINELAVAVNAIIARLDGEGKE